MIKSARLYRLVCRRQSDLRLAHGDRFSKVVAQQIPGGGLPAVTLDQTAQGQDRLSTCDRPSHAGLLQALGDERFAGGFDHTAGDGQTLAEVQQADRVIYFPSGC
jgi:hypothetical protein